MYKHKTCTLHTNEVAKQLYGYLNICQQIQLLLYRFIKLFYYIVHNPFIHCHSVLFLHKVLYWLTKTFCPTFLCNRNHE